MPTQKQREANLRNAHLSSGPKTPEGKAASSHNSFRHGIFASDLTLLDDPETSSEIEAKLTEYVDHFQPATPLERDLIEEIALLEIRKRRIARAETGLLNDARQKLFESDTFLDTDGTLFARYDTSLAEPARQRGVATMHLGAAWNQVAQTIDRMSRHESRLSGQLDKKRRLLADLIASRPPAAAPREPVPAPQEPAPAPSKGPQMATVQNEPNFDLNPNNATPIINKPAAPAAPPSTPPDLADKQS